MATANNTDESNELEHTTSIGHYDRAERRSLLANRDVGAFGPNSRSGRNRSLRWG